MFEWPIWSFLPISYQVIAFLRPMLDAIFFLVLMMKRFATPVKIDLTSRRVLATLGIVIFSVTISTILYQTRLIYELQSIFVVFRFMIILIIPEDMISSKFKQLILYALMLQISIGLIEASGVLNIGSIMMHSSGKWEGIPNFNPTVFRNGPVGISSTFLNTIDYSFYLIASYIAIYWRKKRTLKWIMTVIIYFLIIRTESKTSIIVFSFLLLYELHSVFLRWTVFLVLTVPIVIVLIMNADLVVFFFTNSLQYSRIGFFVYLLPPFFSGNIATILFGVSTDPYVGLEAIRHYPHIPQMLLDENNLLNLKDVFWIAQLFEWGLVGFTTLVALLISMYKRSLSPTTKALLIVVFILGLSNQVLEVKVFSFLLWILIKYHKSFDEDLMLAWK